MCRTGSARSTRSWSASWAGSWAASSAGCLIGRTVSFVAALLTTIVLAIAIERRCGRGRAWPQASSLGSGPMFGFTIMVRPDALAELLGVGGFLLSGGRSRGTAQPVLHSWSWRSSPSRPPWSSCWPPRWPRSSPERSARDFPILGAASALLLAVVVVVTVLATQLRPLAGRRAVMPWSFPTWLTAIGGSWSPVPAPGVPRDRSQALAWRHSRPRAVRPATLVLVLLSSSLILSAKLGADINYYLSLRVAEALRGGRTLACRALTRHRPPPAPAIRPAGRDNPPGVCSDDSLHPDGADVRGARQYRVRVLRDAKRAPPSATYREATALARTRVHLLTDVGLLDLHQGERAAFGDPWLFRTLVETGRLQPTAMARRIDSQYYDVFITTHDLNSPRYVDHDFRLPKGLFERVRASYVLPRSPRGLQYYVPRCASDESLSLVLCPLL